MLDALNLNFGGEVGRRRKEKGERREDRVLLGMYLVLAHRSLMKLRYLIAKEARGAKSIRD